MSRASGGTVSALQILPWLAALDALGITSDKILSRAGVSRERLTDPHARLPVEIERVFWEAALAESRDPALSLRLVPHLPAGAFGSFEYLLRNSDTLEETAQRANEFMRLLDDLARVELHRDGELTALRLSRIGASPMVGEGVETVFGLLISIARQRGMDPSAYLREVRFTHRTTASVELFEACFGCPVRFGAEHNELLTDPRGLSAKLVGDANLRRLLEEHARHQLQQVPEGNPLLHAVRSRLLGQLRLGPPNLATVARSLHVSERTLRRHLQDAGSGYQELLDQLRAQLAIEYVRNPDLGIANVATQLGFSDPSTFYRAFKRWTGMTPLQYREHARLDSPSKK